MNDPAAFEAYRTARQIGSSSGRGGAAPILARVGDRNLLFSEAHQAISELSDFAAYVWRSLDAGMSPAAIADELIAAGVDPDGARCAVTAMLAEVEALRTVSSKALPQSAPASSDRLARLTILIADVTVQLNLCRSLAADVEAVFGALLTDARDYDMVLCAREVGSFVDVFSAAQPSWSCERAQFIPLLKAELIECVLRRARYEVALHAAALARGKGAMLLLGAPGAGKTTLAIALAKAGLEVLADDVVLLNRNGLITGLALPFTAKASSWPLLSRHWPGLAAHPRHRRPDGQTLCYIPFDPVDDLRPRPIDVIVLLNRRDAARTRIEELDLAAALGALVAEGATRDERLAVSGFMALVDGLREARCCRLTYSDLKEAASAVRSFPL